MQCVKTMDCCQNDLKACPKMFFCHSKGTQSGHTGPSKWPPNNFLIEFFFVMPLPKLCPVTQLPNDASPRNHHQEFKNEVEVPAPAVQVLPKQLFHATERWTSNSTINLSWAVRCLAVGWHTHHSCDVHWLTLDTRGMSGPSLPLQSKPNPLDSPYHATHR